MNSSTSHRPAAARTSRLGSHQTAGSGGSTLLLLELSRPWANDVVMTERALGEKGCSRRFSHGSQGPAHARTGHALGQHSTGRLNGGRFPRTPFAVPNKGSTARVHSVARTMSASSHTSPRPHVSTFRAWHQPWACDDCRPLGLARLCFIAEHRVPVRSLRLIPCTSGKTGGWEPRGVPLAHMLPNVAPHAVSGDVPNMCVDLRCESRIAVERQRSPTRSR